MKLAELLNVDTTKENWFKLLSKKGINPKTVDAVSKGGGGTSINDEALDEPLYYKLEWPEDITDKDGQLVLMYLMGVLPLNSYVVMEGGYKDMPQIEVPANIGLVWGPKAQVKIKITNKYFVGKEENDYVVYWYKANIFDFIPVLLELFSSLGLNMIEISKEEYYSDIEVKYEDIPIQQM